MAGPTERIQEIYFDHHLAILLGVNEKLLNSENLLTEALHETADDLSLTIVSSFNHRFHPQGLSVILIISESHLAAHTWPEFQTMHIDVFSCARDTGLVRLPEVLQNRFDPKLMSYEKLNYAQLMGSFRRLPKPPSSLQFRQDPHFTEV